MLHCITDGYTKRQEHNLRDNKERHSKYDVANRPTVFECSEHKHELWHYVNDGTDCWPENVDDPETDRRCALEPCEWFERGDCYKERDAENEEARQSQKLFPHMSEKRGTTWIVLNTYP